MVKFLISGLIVTSILTTAFGQTKTTMPANAAADEKKISTPVKSDKDAKVTTVPAKSDTDAKKIAAPATSGSETPKTNTAKKTKDTPPKNAKTDAEKEADRQKLIKEADKKKADWVEQTLKYGINKDRREAISLISTIKDESRKNQIIDQLIDYLPKEKDMNVTVKALYTLGELKDVRCVKSAVFCLNSESEDVRIASVYCLKELNAVETKNELIERLKKQKLSEDSNYTNALIQTLSSFKAGELAEFAQTQIEDNRTTKNIRAEFYLYLGNINTPAVQAFLLKVFNDQNEELEYRSYAVNGLAKQGAKQAIPDINRTINEIDLYNFDKKKKYYSFYIYCVTSLTRLGDPEAFPRLEDALRSDSTPVRLQAIKLIKDLKDTRAIEILKYKVDYDPNQKVQSEALKALKELGVDYKPKSGVKPDDEKSKETDKDTGKEKNNE